MSGAVSQASALHRTYLHRKERQHARSDWLLSLGCGDGADRFSRRVRRCRHYQIWSPSGLKFDRVRGMRSTATAFVEGHQSDAVSASPVHPGFWTAI